MASEERDDKHDEGAESRTAWHPMLVTLFEKYVPSGWKVIPELLLNRLPQRVDIVVIRLEGTPTSPARKLHSIFDYLRKHTLIEFKGPTDDLEAIDALTLLGYGCQYMAMNKVLEPNDVRLMVVADRIPPSFVRQIEKLAGKFVAVGTGLWQGHIAGLSLHGVELREAHKAGVSEALLRGFCKEFLKKPELSGALDTEDIEMYRLLYQQVAQFRKDPRTMALRDIDVAEKSFKEAVDRLLQDLPIEQRLKGLTPEQILAALSPEAREALARKLRD